MSIHVVCCVSDERVYAANLGRSHDEYVKAHHLVGKQFIKGWTFKRNVVNVNRAYNEVIREGTNADWWAFIHEDVYLPPEWYDEVMGGFKVLRDRRIHSQVVGVAGVDADGNMVGNLLNRGLEWGKRVPVPLEVKTIDECVMFVRAHRAPGPLYFDEEAPNHHLSAADACIRGCGLCHVIRGYCEHNRRQPQEVLDLGFLMSCGYYWAKWPKLVYPVNTTCCSIDIGAQGLPVVTI